MVTFRQLEILFGFTMEKEIYGTSRKMNSKGVGLQSLMECTLPQGPRLLRSGALCLRYVHKALANTFFARKATGTINEENWSPLDKRRSTPPGWMDIKFCKTNLSLSTRSWMGGGTNIDFRPPVYTLIGHEADLQEEEPSSIELRIELRFKLKIESRRVHLGEPECYYFEEYEAPRMNPSVVAAHKRIGLSKGSQVAREGHGKMQKSMDKMVSKIKSLEKKVSGSSSKKKKGPMAPTFPRSRSLLTTQRRLSTQEPHRASSFEPREGEDNTQRRRKTSKARRSSSTTGLDRVQTEETQLDRAEGRADLEEPLFENPGFEYDPTQYQDFSQTNWTPYNSFEQAQLLQGQGSHTHFEDEEEEEEEPQARPSEAIPVAWSAPDGRLPSPDRDLASQFFGGH
ncbi:unnamed protein product [Microthlaspi erraticum]|uniref:Arabidopsis retrotransposon Orf1 C-terminal domain-containing protein n=1 Tax=Microthlaspi erraticum TaxID=1685480 RepID=A0A6D2IGL1_9BRAS|nr:unnamed protein product [Microthlaspi erraticum]